MVSRSQFVFTLLFGLVAVLYQIDTDPGVWEASESAHIYASREQLERFIGNPDSVEKWFRWVSLFKAADSRPFSIGKKFQALYNVPFLGEYMMLFKVTKYQPNTLMVLETDSLIKPRFTVLMEEGGTKGTRLTFKLRYRRISALFQWTLGPFLYFLTGQQLQHSLFMLKMMFPF
ncbi:uncharacterized protein [Palaemon carinicauda]|uniref:uncharacterized protein n=1 Tax=Palaemon carinicauda TaxID=392227 RepID=UPI0035B66A79